MVKACSRPRTEATLAAKVEVVRKSPAARRAGSIPAPGTISCMRQSRLTGGFLHWSLRRVEPHELRNVEATGHATATPALQARISDAFVATAVLLSCAAQLLCCDSQTERFTLIRPRAPASDGLSRRASIEAQTSRFVLQLSCYEHRSMQQPCIYHLRRTHEGRTRLPVPFQPLPNRHLSGAHLSHAGSSRAT